jgi:hypothetical protein
VKCVSKLWLAFMLVASLLTASTLNAKRLEPKLVPPVIFNGVQYSAEGHGRDAFVTAKDIGNEDVLWRTKIFRSRIKPWLEEDVQWVFITALKLQGTSLHIRDEKSRCYSLDLKTKRARRHACDADLDKEHP